MEEIDITGLDKRKVLMALYDPRANAAHLLQVLCTAVGGS